MPKNLLVLTRGLARYRSDFLDGIAFSLPESWILVHSTISRLDTLWEVDWKERLQRKGRITHINYPKISWRTYTTALGRRLGIKRKSPSDETLEGIEPDIILIQEYSLRMLYAAFYAKLAGIPCYACSDLGKKSDWAQNEVKKGARLAHQLGPYLTDGLIAHTPSALDPVSGRSRPRLFCPHGVSIEQFQRTGQRQASDQLTILMVAQYIERKGHDLLADAAALLFKQGIRNFQIRLVGTKDPQWVESVIRERKLESIMTVAGKKTGRDLLDEYENADIFVLTSRFDTFAVVVHEAAAFGLPLVISSRADASSVLVEEEKNGFIVDPFDTERLAGKLGILLSNPELRSSFGKESRTIAKNLDPKHTGRNLVDWIFRVK